MRFPIPTCLALAFILTLSACSSSGPRLGGFGLGQGRIVSVGDVIDLRLPLQADGGRQWRVTSYDSLYLAIAERPTVVPTGNGNELLIKARAKNQGETVIEVTEQLDPRTATRPPRIVRFNVTIVE